MPVPYAIREIEPVATDELLELVRSALGEGSVPRTREFWNWKHVESPFGPSYALAAEADGRLVGLRMFLRWRFRCGERELAAVRAVDTVTHPDWQGRGIFTRLTLAMLERVERDGVAFVFNTPNRASRAGYLKMGWRDVGRVPVLVKPLRPWRMLFGSNGESPAGRVGATGETGVTAPQGSVPVSERTGTEDRAPRVPPLPGTVPVSELLASEASAALASAAARDDGRLHTPCTPEYLRWRYQAVPGIEYRAAWRREGEVTVATIVRARRRRGRHELSLSDLLESAGSEAARLTADLLAELASHSKAATIDYLAIAAPAAGPRGQALRRRGFRAIPTGTPRLTVRPLAETSPSPTRWSSWSLSTGDLELF